MANTLAYGFLGLERLSSQRVSKVGVARVFDAVRESVAEYSRGMNGLLASFVERTTVAKEQRELPGAGTLQPLDEWGNPRPVIEEGNYDVAYPIFMAGTAWGDNRITSKLITVEEANRRTLEAMRRDHDWMRRHILASIFDNVAWTYNDEIGPDGAAGLGNITIEALANTDTVTYTRIGGASAVDEHYLAQSASIDDSNNPFDDIYDELMEHPSNGGGPVVVYVPTNLTTSIEALTSFVAVDDPAIIYGVQTDRVGAAPFDRGLGDELLGRIDKCWVVEWRALPSSYMIAHAQGGGPVVKMREYDDASLQGFFTELHSPDGNRQIVRMLRACGFGVSNRIAACVQRIGNASYAIPSGYNAPLAA